MVKLLLIMISIGSLLVVSSGFQDPSESETLSIHAGKLEILGEAGHWNGTGRFRDIGFTCEMERRWSADKGAMFFTQSFFSLEDTEKKKPVAVNSGIFGWDAASRKIKSTWFITDGRSATDYLVAKEQLLIGTRVLSNPDGSENEHEVSLELHPDGKIDYRSVDKETQETVLQIEWIRQNKEEN